MPSLLEVILALAAAALLAPYLCSKLEERSARKLAEMWAKVPGAVR